MMAQTLVELQLAACVNVSSVTSHYQWQDQLCQDPELALTIKTRATLYAEVEAKILELHPYDLPELIVLPVNGGYAPYLEWVHRETVFELQHQKSDIIEERKMIQVASKAPDFKLNGVLPDGSVKEVKLEDYKGKWVVVFFYPLDFTFVCPTEITGFSAKNEDFQKLGAEIVGVSVDSVYSHMAWINNDLGRINFPLLSDMTKEMSRDYGVLLESVGVSLRGAFIIDPDGILKWQVVHDLGIGRSVDEVLRVLGALQTGDLCPANWKDGEKTLGKA